MERNGQIAHSNIHNRGIAKKCISTIEIIWDVSIFQVRTIYFEVCLLSEHILHTHTCVSARVQIFHCLYFLRPILYCAVFLNNCFDYVSTPSSPPPPPPPTTRIELLHLIFLNFVFVSLSFCCCSNFSRDESIGSVTLSDILLWNKCVWSVYSIYLLYSHVESSNSRTTFKTF